MFPTFSPDGRQIAFVGSEAGGTPGLYVADIGPAGVLAGGLHARRVGPAAPTLFAGNQPRWSPDGTELAIHTGTAPSRDERHRHRQGRRVGPARADCRQGVQPELVARRHARRVSAHGGPIGTIHRPAMHDAHLGHQCGRHRGATARPPDRRLRLRTAVVTRRDAAAGEPHRRRRVPCRRRERRRRRAARDPRPTGARRGSPSLRRCLRPRRSAAVVGSLTEGAPAHRRPRPVPGSSAFRRAPSGRIQGVRQAVCERRRRGR